MTILKIMISKIKIIMRGRKVKESNFFDYSPGEKRKIVESAARNAAKMKRDTIKRYNLAYSSK